MKVYVIMCGSSVWERAGDRRGGYVYSTKETAERALKSLRGYTKRYEMLAPTHVEEFESSILF